MLKVTFNFQPQFNPHLKINSNFPQYNNLFPLPKVLFLNYIREIIQKFFNHKKLLEVN
jgi:hypothetical protein